MVAIDLRGRSAMADHMVIASGRNARQVAAIAEKLVERLKEQTGHSARVEGKDTGDWVLIDTDDVIVHVFRPEVREFYQLEKMWMPADALRSVTLDRLRAELPRWQRQYRTTYAQNDGYRTHGVLVPLAEFERIAAKVW